ncbi:MAG: hypothetical protein AAF982_08950 [Pseudomonadota bacterium]
MPKFALIYRGGEGFRTPEDGKAHMIKWRAWTATLGSAYVYPGMPFSTAKTIGRDGMSEGSGAVPITGVSVIEAETMEDALKMAESCPHLEIGGDIVVAQGMDMEM